MGFILKKVNHSIWFGYGDFHTNTVERLWPQIKRLTDNFSGLKFSRINNLFNSDEEKNNYLDVWICYGLLLREIDKKKYKKMKV